MQQMGLQARLMSQALRKMSGNASKAGCTLIFLNQIRYKVVFLVDSEFSACCHIFIASLPSIDFEAGLKIDTIVHGFF